MPLFRKRKQVFRQERQVVHVDTQLAGSCAEQVSADADVVAQVEQLVDFEAFLPDRVLLDVSLEALSVLLQLSKPGLAHQPNRQNPPGDADVDARGFQFFGGLGGIFRENLRDRTREVVTPGIRLLPQGLELLELLTPELINVFVQCQENLPRPHARSTKAMCGFCCGYKLTIIANRAKQTDCRTV